MAQDVKYWRAEDGQTGLWGLSYRFEGRPSTGIMLSTTTAGWLLSGSILGRGAGIGWANRRFNGPEFTVSLPKRRPRAAQQ